MTINFDINSQKKKYMEWFEKHKLLKWVFGAVGGNWLWYLLLSAAQRKRDFYLFVIDNSVSDTLTIQDAVEAANVLSLPVFWTGVAMITVCLIFTAVAYHVGENSANRKSLSRQKELESKENQLKNRVEILEGEKAELDRSLAPYIEWNNLISCLEEYVSKSEIVDGIQFYNKPTLPSCDSIAAGDQVAIHLQFKDGCSKESSNVNVMHSVSYYLQEDIYRPLMEILHLRYRYYQERKRKDYRVEEEIQTKAISLAKKLTEQLNQLSVTDVHDIHFTYYRVLEILTTLVLNQAKGVEIQQLLQCKEGVEDHLRKGYRTGVLGAMLLNTTYVFSNENSPTKRDRYYFATPLIYKENKMIMSVVLQGNMLRTGPQHDKLKCCEEIFDDINDLLKSTAQGA